MSQRQSDRVKDRKRADLPSLSEDNDVATVNKPGDKDIPPEIASLDSASLDSITGILKELTKEVKRSSAPPSPQKIQALEKTMERDKDDIYVRA